MVRTKVDYTIFFRQLAKMPDGLSGLKKSFYEPTSVSLHDEWTDWLHRWRTQVAESGDLTQVSASMKQVNPSVTWREWLIAPAYQQAEQGQYDLVHELQGVFSHPYDEVPFDLAVKYDRLKPKEFFNAGGVSHYSCSS